MPPRDPPFRTSTPSIFAEEQRVVLPLPYSAEASRGSYLDNRTGWCCLNKARCPAPYSIMIGRLPCASLWSRSPHPSFSILYAAPPLGDSAIPLLILFSESLDVRFTVRVEEFLATLLPRRFELGRGDVPVRPAFFGNGAQVLAEIFHRRPTEEPVAHVDLINDKAGREDNHVGNH